MYTLELSPLRSGISVSCLLISFGAEIDMNGTVMNKSRPIGRVMIAVIILLYIVTTVSTALIWFFVRDAFVNSGQNFFTVYEALTTPGIIPGVMGTTGCICSILADTTIVGVTLLGFSPHANSLCIMQIWRCWIVWGRRWLTILLPILLLFSAIGKIIQIFYISRLINAWCSVQNRRYIRTIHNS